MPALTIVLRENISSIVTLVAGVFFLLSIPSQIGDFGTDGLSGVSARTMPYIIASAIIGFSLLPLISSIYRLRDTEAIAEIEPQSAPRYGLIFLAFLSITAWIIILPYVGYNIATILLIGAIMKIIGNTKWWQIVILALALSFPVNILLALVLKVYLPSGSLFG